MDKRQTRQKLPTSLMHDMLALGVIALLLFAGTAFSKLFLLAGWTLGWWK